MVSIYPPIYLSFFQSFYQSIYLSIYLSIYQAIYLSIYISIYLIIHLFSLAWWPCLPDQPTRRPCQPKSSSPSFTVTFFSAQINLKSLLFESVRTDTTDRYLYIHITIYYILFLHIDIFISLPVKALCF